MIQLAHLEDVHLLVYLLLNKIKKLTDKMQNIFSLITEHSNFKKD